MSIQEFVKVYYPSVKTLVNRNYYVMQQALFNTNCRHRGSELLSGRFSVKKFESAIREAFTYFGYQEGMDFIISRDTDNQAIQIRYRCYSSDIDVVIFDYIQYMRIVLEKKGVAQGLNECLIDGY